MLIVYSSSFRSQSLNVDLFLSMSRPATDLLAKWLVLGGPKRLRTSWGQGATMGFSSLTLIFQFLAALHGSTLQSSNFVNGLDVDRCRWMRMRSIMTRCWKLSVQSQHGSWMLWNGKSFGAKAPAKRDVAHLARTLPGRNASEKLADFTWAARHVLVPNYWPTSCQYFWRKPHSWLFLLSTKKVVRTYISRPSFGMKRSCLCFSVFRGQEVAREATGRHFEEIRSGIHSQVLQQKSSPVQAPWIILYHTLSYFIIMIRVHHPISIQCDTLSDHTSSIVVHCQTVYYHTVSYIIMLCHAFSCLIISPWQ